MSVGIQLADMVAGAVWRFYEKNDNRWLDLIKPAFRTDKQGIIDGFGVARFPKRGLLLSDTIDATGEIQLIYYGSPDLFFERN